MRFLLAWLMVWTVLWGSPAVGEEGAVPYANRVAATIQAATAADLAKEPGAFAAEEVKAFRHPLKENVFLNKWSAKATIGEYTGAFRIALDGDLGDTAKSGFKVHQGDAVDTIQVLSKTGKRGGKTVRVVVARRKIGRALLGAVIYPDTAAGIDAVGAEAIARLETLISFGKKYGLFGGLVAYWQTPNGLEPIASGRKLTRSVRPGSTSHLTLVVRFEGSDGRIEAAREFVFELSGALATVARIEHPKVTQSETTWTVRTAREARVRLTLDVSDTKGLAAVWHDRLAGGVAAALSGGGLRIKIRGTRK